MQCLRSVLSVESVKSTFFLIGVITSLHANKERMFQEKQKKDFSYLGRVFMILEGLDSGLEFGDIS